MTKSPDCSRFVLVRRKEADDAVEHGLGLGKAPRLQRAQTMAGEVADVLGAQEVRPS